MAGASASGNVYEDKVLNAVQRLTYKGAPVLAWGRAGSDKNSPDIDAHDLDGVLQIEAKTKNAFEFGSRKFNFKNGRFELPDDPLFKTCLSADFQPFNGFVPSFLRGDPTQATLNQERKEQKALGNILDVCIDLSDPLMAARYYAAKGVHYIQIEGYGLYRTTLKDPRDLGLPILSMSMKLRYRIKTHKRDKNHSVQAQFICSRRPERSPFDLIDPSRLPKHFSVGSRSPKKV
jgi:hypothetical protein